MTASGGDPRSGHEGSGATTAWEIAGRIIYGPTFGAGWHVCLDDKRVISFGEIVALVSAALDVERASPEHAPGGDPVGDLPCPGCRKSMRGATPERSLANVTAHIVFCGPPGLIDHLMAREGHISHALGLWVGTSIEVMVRALAAPPEAGDP